MKYSKPPRHLLFILFIIFSVSANAQNFQWVRNQTHSFSFNPDLTSFQSETDPAGNSLLAGNYNFKLSYGNFYGDIFLKKYDPQGNLLFAKIMYGKSIIEGMQTDPSGNIYLSGNFMDTLMIDPVNYILNTGSGFNLNYFILKLSPNGDFIWKKNISVLYPEISYLEALKIKGNFLYAGMLNFNQGFIKKFDFAGNELMSIPELNVRGISSIDVDAQGNLYSGGACGNGNITLGNQNFTAPFNYNIYLVKYNSVGSCQWARFVEDVTFQSIDIACDKSDNIYVAGDLNGSFMFGSIQAQGRQWIYDFFLTKLNSSGTFLWLKEVPESATITGDAGKSDVNSIGVDAQNNVWLTGFLRGSVNWGNNIVTTSSSYKDILILKYDPSGNIILGKRAGGTTNNRSDDVSMDNSGNLFISGNFSSSAVFDTISVTGNGNVNSFLAKLSSGMSIGYIDLKMIIEGYYDNASDNMRMQDTVRIYLRNSSPPYLIADSSKALIDPVTFRGSFPVTNAANGNYFIQTRHRNSIETWSSSSVSYLQGSTVNYDLTSAASSAFGNNLRNINSAPVRYAVYSGDADQDGNVNLNDLITINNDASQFRTGYLRSDINGDDIADLTDLIVTFNNSRKFVSVIRP